MNLVTNPQLELAYQYICNTDKHLFLTGKAGSGKTTFLHRIREARMKRLAIVAPTGVAAINAGGMTIHSLFQLPIGLHLPGVERQQPFGRFSAQKTRLLRSLDLVVIDEVSMVRADLLDAVDAVLKRIRNSERPFGGVQLLMIGDLHQLPPVVKTEDWNLLKNYYDTPYFFGSHALRKTDYIAIELKHIYRQSDPEFISLLNQVRDSRLDEHGLRKLNSRYIPNFWPPTDIPYITLTATNASATAINNESLERLPSKKHSFPALITGDFPVGNFPTDENLEVKVGSQVMFIRNDTSEERLFFNGKLGTITRIDDERIAVRCPGENQDILVEPAEWKNIKYTLNEQTKEIEEQLVGSFVQFPLRLAWAITIHKSQGLTFDRCIIDAQAAFASGQVYVALSRCRSLDGIVLRTQISPACVKTDPLVKKFTADAENNVPTETQLKAAKQKYQADLLRAIFDFNASAEAVQTIIQLSTYHAKSITNDIYQPFVALEQQIRADLLGISDKFKPQLSAYLQSADIPSDNEALQTRLRKASAYFVEKIANILQQTKQINVETDNKGVAEQYMNSREELERGLFMKKCCFAACSEIFSAEGVNRALHDAELDYLRWNRNLESSVRVPQDIPHPVLYARLARWRTETADTMNLSEYEIFPNLTLKDLSTSLPKTKNQLTAIRGIGKARLKNYGDAVLSIIRVYCEENKIENRKESKRSLASSLVPTTTTHPAPTKIHTKQISLELHRSGKSVEEIAAERSLAKTTILGHLSHFVEIGALDVSLFLDQTTLAEIFDYLQSNPEATLNTSKEYFKEKYDFGILRMGFAAKSWLEANTEA